MPNEKIDPNEIIIMMLGYLCISTEIEASLSRKVEILGRFKLQDSLIAAICGCKVQAVRDARQRVKKGKK
jgi:hypothetical protein